MFQGPLRPLTSHLPLHNLLAHVRSAELLGAWVVQPQHRRICAQGSSGAGGPLLLSHDLGSLLTRCRRVLVRVGEQPLVLGADTIIRWRALQVATATPHLPGLARLQALFPGLRVTAEGFLVPVPKRSPEEILGLCIAEGVRVTGSRIVYVARQAGTSPRREVM
jgi:hypothetical protein